MPPLLAVSLVFFLVGLSLTVSGALRRAGLTPPVTRWVASVIGGFAYLVAVLWLDAWTASALSAFSVLVLALLRLRRSKLLAGLRWTTAEQSRAELGYPAAATVVLLLGWVPRGDPWFAFLVIAFMAWGDASAGLVRGLTTGWVLHPLAASATMLFVSLGVACLFYPSDRGYAAAIAATLAEAIWPLTRSRVSDNWAVVGSALASVDPLGGMK